MALAAMMALLWQHAAVEVEFGNEALAAVDTSNLTANCTEQNVIAFVPSITYTIVPTASRSAVSCGSSTAIISAAVNGDGNPALTCLTSDSTGYITLSHTASLIKLAGLQCQVGTENSQLEVHDSNDSNSAALDIALASPGSTTWSSSNQVDTATAAAKKMLFGTSGLLLGNKLSDGSDQDGFTNGEIVFGGSGAASSGGHSMINRVDIIDTATDGATESLIYTFTPFGQ